MKPNGTLQKLSGHLAELLRATEHVILEDSDPSLAATLKSRLPSPKTVNQPKPRRPSQQGYDYLPDQMFRQPANPISQHQSSQKPHYPAQSSEMPSALASMLADDKRQTHAQIPNLGKTARSTSGQSARPANERWKSDENIRNASSLEELSFCVRNCQRCQLHESRQNLVLGQGNDKATVMFIGEGPGREEDAEGLAFVGRSGKLLTQMMLSIGLNREDAYIANIVKCRPPENRNPLPEETVACRPLLDKQIELVAPKLIIALGGVALKNLAPSVKGGISAVHGQPLKLEPSGIDLIATFHPSYLLRDPAKMELSWDDFRIIRKQLQLIAKEKAQ